MPSPSPPLRPGDSVEIRAERWRVVRHVPYGDTTFVDVAGCDRTNRHQRARFLLPYEPFARVTATGAPRVVRAARWRQHARHRLAEASPEAHALRAVFDRNASILPFQLEPALAIVQGLGCRLLIADEVGLGKTVQAALLIAEVLQRQTDAHALVVTPAGLREQWQHELEGRLRLQSLVLDAAALARAQATAPAGGNPWVAHAVIVISIDYVKRPEVMRALEALIWDVVVFDEAHALSGRSDRAAAAGMLAERARTVVLLSATPHDGDDETFGRLCRIGDQDGRFALLFFRRTRQDAGLTTSRREQWLRVRPTPAERAMHAALLAYARLVWAEAGPNGGGRLAMSVLTRRACSSAASLARSIERRMDALEADAEPGALQLALPLDDAGAGDAAPSAVLMGPGLHDRAEERRRLQHLLHLARAAAAAESKFTALARLLRRTREPAIVFTEYRDTLAQLARHVSEPEIVQLHGGMTRSERATALHRFTTGGARLLLATDAASEGLNLHQQCRLVVHLELPWTPLRLEQRVGRVERIGQTRRVHAIHLVAAGTSEETVVARLLRRMARMQTALQGLRPSCLGPDDVPRAVFEHEGPPAAAVAPPAPAFPPGVLVPDLRALAAREAERLLLARRLRPADASLIRAGNGRARPAPGTSRTPQAPYAAESRAVITSIRRRQSHPSGYWAFRHDIVDADGYLLWEQLIVLHAVMRERPPRDTRLLRALLNPDQAVLARALARERERATAAARTALAPLVAIGLRREHALMAAIARRHARLAAALLQPGLFDRRAERAAAAQAVTRDQALARCTERLRRLTSSRTPGSGFCAPDFAVVVG